MQIWESLLLFSLHPIEMQNQVLNAASINYFRNNKLFQQYTQKT